MDWRWSSARSHISIKPAAFLKMTVHCFMWDYVWDYFLACLREPSDSFSWSRRLLQGCNKDQNSSASLQFSDHHIGYQFLTESTSKSCCLPINHLMVQVQDTYQISWPSMNLAGLSGLLVLDYWLFPESKLKVVKLPSASTLLKCGTNSQKSSDLRQCWLLSNPS